MSARRSGAAAPRPPLAAYGGAWAVLATVYAVLYTTSGVSVFMAARGAVAAVLPDALLGLVSLRLARRWPWPGGAARLVPALVALALASTAGWLLLIELDALVVTGATRWPTGPIVLWQTVINMLIHVALCGIGFAWHAAEALGLERDRASRAEVLRTRAELELLRSQLQPHFVLNTLHALLGLIRREPARAENVLERLGDLLRYGQWVHQSGSDWVPLSREWEFVTSYLELESVRLGGRLSVEMHADAAALEMSVPPFALQPLVENAVIHGIAPRASGGVVAVSARRAGSMLRLEVLDDGPGASPEAIAASPRTGLRLLQARLGVLYAGRARVEFESVPSGGFCARLELPAEGAAEVA